MKRKKILTALAVTVMSIGLGSCAGLGWSVSSDPYGGPDVGLYFGGSYNPPPPPPPPMAPRPGFGGFGPGWPGPW